MTAANVQALVEDLHRAARPLVLAITGGGTRALSTLLSVPGASRSVLEAVVPYSAAALDQWLGAKPEHYCSSRTARAMAMAAFVRARKLAGAAADAEKLLGVGVTASLATNRPKRGPHRVHLACQAAGRTTEITLLLNKGARSRPSEEDLAAQLVLSALADEAGLVQRLPELRLAGELWSQRRIRAPAAWQGLLLGQVKSVRGHEAQVPEPGRIVFPGAFNPWHQGHRRMAEHAQERLGRPVELELSIFNVDKPPLDYLEIGQRCQTLDAGTVYWLTAAPSFVEKARLFPRATFVVGADTVDRIAQPRYYQHDRQAAAEAWRELERCGAHFLVFARRVQGSLRTLANLNLPEPLASLCSQVPPEEFCQDISSTELRRQRQSSEPSDD